MQIAHRRIVLWRLVVVTAALSAAVPGALEAGGATHDVAVVDNFFIPAQLEIEVGDTVVWTYAEGDGFMFHDVVADDGSFNSGAPAPPPWTFQHTFTAAGEFPYFCSVHGAPGGLGMAGVIIVVEPTQAPIADISPSSFEFQVVEGGSDSDTLNIGNLGTANLDWSIDLAEPGDGCASPVPVPWLAVAPDAGATKPASSVPVDVSVDTTGLAAGEYEALICVATNDPDAALVEVPVSLTVEADPVPIADISPSSFSFEVPEGGSDSGVLEIGNLGGANLVWSIDTDELAGAGGLREIGRAAWRGRGEEALGELCDDPSAVSWLAVDPDGGITPPGDSVPVDVSVDAAGLTEGVYEAALCVTTNDPEAPLVVVPVELTVLGPCPIDEHLVLEDQTVVGTEIYEACFTITAGPNFVVSATGDLTLRAGQQIILRDGFAVDAGGVFTAEIDPELSP
jgi:plastocyanin